MINLWCPECFEATSCFFIDNASPESITQWGTCDKCSCVVKATYRKLFAKELETRLMVIGHKEKPIYEYEIMQEKGACTQ